MAISKEGLGVSYPNRSEDPFALRVSIIMPTYNRGWIVGRAIDSVLAQSFKNFELVIVNDGSVDETDTVLERYTDKRIAVVKSEVNCGLSAARNLGLKNAKGELVAYLDSDNLWYHNYLEVMSEAFKDGNTVMAYSGQNLLLVGGAKDNPKVLGRKTRNESFNPDRLLTYPYIDINSVVHTRALFDEVGYFDESVKVLEDWDLFLRITIAHPFGVRHIDQVMGEYYFLLPEVDTTLSNQHYLGRIKREFDIDGLEVDKFGNRIDMLLQSRDPNYG